MTFNRLNRRTHLYLALALIPWFVVYGFSSVFFSHPGLLDPLYDDGVPQRTVLGEFAFDEPLPGPGEELGAIRDRIVATAGLEGVYGVWRPPRGDRLNVIPISFLSKPELVYYPAEKKVVVQQQRFRADHFFTRLHARGGFQHDAFFHDAWAVLVDVVCIAFCIWVASGIYMWWLLPACRRWGALALGGGVLTFAFYTFWL